MESHQKLQIEQLVPVSEIENWPSEYEAEVGILWNSTEKDVKIHSPTKTHGQDVPGRTPNHTF
jgi:hypothetical protein